MMSAFTPRSGKQKTMAKIQFVVLTVALLLALVVLPASADHEEEAEYTFAFEEASASSTVGLDASSTRLAALGEFYTAKMLEPGHKANSGRYNQLAAFYAGSDGGMDGWAAGAGDYGTKNLAAVGTEDSGFLSDDDPVHGAWSRAEAEFYAGQGSSDAKASPAGSDDDPANGAWSRAEAEFYVDKGGSDAKASPAGSDDDPANGAWTQAEAEFYAGQGSSSAIAAGLCCTDSGPNAP